VRLGSVYFALSDVEKAKQAYRKALEIDPNDQNVREFMKEQGWQ
jgi:cytochrome c-type biogenesis protein CcmH/NrfG